MRRILISLMVTLATVIGLSAVTATPAVAASGWRTMHRWGSGSVFLACKYSENGPYGPVWQVRLVLAHQPNTAPVHLRATLVVQRMGADGVYRSIGETRLATDRSGQWDVKTATGSQLGAFVNGRWNADRWSYGFGDENGGAGDVNPNSFNTISNC